ncbi:MAG: hypothetical protein HYZ10_02370 [Ignavibacteriales bacterium]|nr:hypothetical protein [Ignavibacteriales bacterium]
MNEIFYITNAILLLRLIFYFSDAKPKLWHYILHLVIFISATLIYQFGLALVLVWIFYSLLLFSEPLLIKKPNKSSLHIYRIVQLILILSILFTLIPNPLQLNFYRIEVLNFSQNSFIGKVFYHLTWERINLFVFGVLMTMNEANIVIRLIFFFINKQVEKSELNTGRIIGLLERIIIFIFVYNSQFESVGLVVAAKTIIRWKKLDEKEYAEYVIIGTLLSVLLAVIIAMIVKSITKIIVI